MSLNCLIYSINECIFIISNMERTIKFMSKYNNFSLPIQYISFVIFCTLAEVLTPIKLSNLSTVLRICKLFFKLTFPCFNQVRLRLLLQPYFHYLVLFETTLWLFLYLFQFLFHFCT